MAVEVSAGNGDKIEIEEYAGTGGTGESELLGKLNLSWATLDYILRIALKRVRGLKITDSATNEIFEYQHGTLIDKLLTEYSTNLPVIAELSKVGKTRSGSEYYAKRNQYIHALWAKDKTGNEIFLRVGTKDWRNPVSYNPADVLSLIRDIEETAKKINSIT